MILICQPKFGIFQRSDLKKYIEKTELAVKRILTLPVAEAICLSSNDNMLEEKDENLNKYILIDWNSSRLKN